MNKEDRIRKEHRAREEKVIKLRHDEEDDDEQD